MKKEIYHNAWHKLSGEEIITLFDNNFGSSISQAPDGTSVKIAPNMQIVIDLKELGNATLELLENREASTIYRIKQTGIVYQLCQPNGDLLEFDDYEQYLQAEPIDKPITIYAPKPLKFTAEKVGDKLIVKHHEPPQFEGEWIGGVHGVENVKWPNGQPSDFMEVPRLMQKLGAFMNTYFKENGKKNNE
jgi:hypothetical protein